MDREIKFRGKRVDNGEWVYGYYVKTPSEQSRIYYQPFGEASNNTYHIVIQETVGQYTVVKDRNGKEIYEGDLLQIPETNENISGIHKVYYYKDSWVTCSILYTDDEYATKHSLKWRLNRGAYNVGNIHDNPDLLK